MFSMYKGSYQLNVGGGCNIINTCILEHLGKPKERMELFHSQTTLRHEHTTERISDCLVKVLTK